ncbi:MAG: EamA family transporter [Deltaproteobacteria bacterium]|nr:EamA family transporter [Deltaproteobacteria bacterium]
MLTENAKAIIAWLNVSVIWGTTFLVIRIGVGHLPPMLFAGIRWVLAGAIFIFFLRWRGWALPKAKELIHLAVVGLALLGFANGLVVFAEQWIPSGLTALLLTTMPFFMVGLESLLPKGPKLNAAILTGLVMGLVGVCLIFGEEVKYLNDPDNLIGVFALLGAVCFWSAGSLYSKYVKVDVHPLMGASVQMLIAGIFLSVIGISIGELSRLSFEINGLLSLAYLILFGSFVGYASYIYALAKLPLSLVSTFAYINPVIALFLGWIILDEKLNLQIVIAAVVIIAGVFIVKQGAARLKNS